MATKVGVTSRGQQQESMTRANNAIDGILANAAFDDKRLRLKKTYKTAKKQADLYGSRVTARADRYAKGAESLSGLSGTINEQNRQAKALSEAWEQAQKKNATAWQEEFNSKPKFQNLNNKQRQKAWTDYYERKAQALPEYGAYQRVAGQSKATSAQYKSRQGSLDAQRARYESMVKQQKRAYDRYSKAVKAYNRFTTYVPYRPA